MHRGICTTDLVHFLTRRERAAAAGSWMDRVEISHAARASAGVPEAPALSGFFFLNSSITISYLR